MVWNWFPLEHRAGEVSGYVEVIRSVCSETDVTIEVRYFGGCDCVEFL